MFHFIAEIRLIQWAFEDISNCMISSSVFQDRHFSAGKMASLVHRLMIISNPTSAELRVAFSRDGCDGSECGYLGTITTTLAELTSFPQPPPACGFDLKQKAHLTTRKA